MGIFGVVCLIFFSSAYHLFSDGRDDKDGAHRPIETASTAKKLPMRTSAPSEVSDSAARVPASVQSTPVSIIPYETKCKVSGETHDTTSNKLRIVGPFCGTIRGIAANHALISDIQIENTTNHYVATVFIDRDSMKFSTDFIPLDQGINKISMAFHYKSGKVVPVGIDVTKK